MRSLLALVCLALAAPQAARADDPTFQVTFENGKIEPLRIEVPAKTRIRLELVNKGDTPAEFESKPLRLEKVLAPHSQSVLVIRTLDAGEYPFFDDFHPDAPQAVRGGAREAVTPAMNEAQSLSDFRAPPGAIRRVSRASANGCATTSACCAGRSGSSYSSMPRCSSCRRWRRCRHAPRISGRM